MENISVFFISFLLSFLTVDAKKRQAIKVGEATVQHWAAGMPNGLRSGNGDHYLIKLYVNTAKPVEITKVWIGGKEVPCRIESFASIPPKTTAFGDSLVLDYNTADGENKNPSPTPPKYKGVAIVEYTVAGKAYYFAVKEFRKLPDYIGL